LTTSPENACAVHLYVKFGKLVLREEEALFLLSCTSSKDRPVALPSWCPNFDSEPKTRRISDSYAAGWPAHRHRCELAQSTLRITTTNNHASFGQKSDCYVSFDSKVIRIPGAFVDTVAQVGEIYPPPAPLAPDDFEGWRHYGRQILAWLDSNLRVCQFVSNAPADKVSEPFWRTLVGDMSLDLNHFPTDETQLENYATFRKYHELLGICDNWADVDSHPLIAENVTIWVKWAPI
jgi:hypothetical protein